MKYMFELSLHFVTKVILFIVCVSMSIVLNTVPIPKANGLRNYKISLRILSSSYLILALLSFLVLIFKIPDNAREYLTFTVLAVSVLQASLFTGTVIILLNFRFFTLKRFVLFLGPFLVFLLFFLISSSIFGNPVISKLESIPTLIENPTIIIRLAFYAYYMVHLVILTKLYLNEKSRYNARSLNYFSDERYLKLSWVNKAFFSALFVGIVVMFSFLVSLKYDWVFNLIYSAFYLGFAVMYLRYHKIFEIIYPVIETALQPDEEQKSQRKPRISWEEVKELIQNQEMYLEAGITIEEMATRVGVGRTTLSNLINKEEDMNFSNWITQLRIEKSKSIMLLNPQLSISEIAEQVGFTEQSNFSRKFKLVTGQSPLLWKKAEIQHAKEHCLG